MAAIPPYSAPNTFLYSLHKDSTSRFSVLSHDLIKHMLELYVPMRGEALSGNVNISSPLRVTKTCQLQIDKNTSDEDGIAKSFETTAFAISRLGTMYLYDGGSSQVYAFSQEGLYLYHFSTPHCAYVTLSISQLEDLYIADKAEEKTYVYRNGVNLFSFCFRSRYLFYLEKPTGERHFSTALFDEKYLVNQALDEVECTFTPSDLAVSEAQFKLLRDEIHNLTYFIGEKVVYSLVDKKLVPIISLTESILGQTIDGSGNLFICTRYSLYGYNRGGDLLCESTCAMPQEERVMMTVNAAGVIIMPCTLNKPGWIEWVEIS